MKLKLLIFICIIFSFLHIALAQDSTLDYRVYHKKINIAEELIFLKNDSIGGLLLFDSVFNKYDFVFADDCIEAFQLAILYKQNDLAMNFIKKAMDNGLRLEDLAMLNCGCPHDFYAEINKRVTIFDNFIKKNKNILEQYETKAFAKYVKKINRLLLQEIINRHIKEQIYKNYIPEMGIDITEYKKIYHRVSDENLAYIVSKFKKGEYIGEKNIGIIDKKLLKDLGIKYLNENGILDKDILKKYGIPYNIKVPITTYKDYFSASPLYIILFHNDKSFEMLAKYKDDAIKKGYLHPREYASLKLKYGSSSNYRINNVEMRLNSYYKKIANTEEINQMREEYLLPKYEVDLKKHEIAHKYCLKLSFGFFNGTR